jgi:predicted nucleic acid-binding protein
MSALIVLDTGVLGMVTNPQASPEVNECNQWLESLVRKEKYIVVSEIADYEIRRELLRADKIRGIARLDALKAAALYLPITTQTMLKAAEFWATARKQGKPTADDKALDGDVILAAQAFLLSQRGHDIVIATTNVKHPSLFVTAKHWSGIT